MASIKKALAVGAITIASFPSIVFAQQITSTKFKDIDVFSGTVKQPSQEAISLSQHSIDTSNRFQGLDAINLQTHDSADKALSRVYKKVNMLLDELVDEMTKSKNTPPWMWRR